VSVWRAAGLLIRRLWWVIWACAMSLLHQRPPPDSSQHPPPLCRSCPPTHTHPLCHPCVTPHPSRELTLVPPCLGFSQRLLNRDHGATYYADMPRHGVSGAVLRRHGDEVARWPGGYYSALGRCDDTMNLGGIKVCGCGCLEGGRREWGS
jgi:hypothetical protein